VYKKDSAKKVDMVFGRYAELYDTFYKKKNYKKECDFLEQLFTKYTKRNPKTILDLGCGTGGHMLALAQRGYTLTGIDASPKMLALARQKFSKNDVKAEFSKNKLQSFKVLKKFDAIVCLFSVIDYVTQDKDLLKTFRNVARHMKRTSLFIFDFWRTEAVENYFSPQKKNVFRTKDRIVERHSSTTIDRKNRLCEVSYKVHLKGNVHPKKSFQEKHCLRYFSVNEMGSFLQKAGLNILGLHPFLNINGTVRANTWDVTVVAQRI
jgi:2-polyprenyl-3-methyl-5-hydroxy-6-metoxy-1,4-benzoquinol methylase